MFSVLIGKHLFLRGIDHKAFSLTAIYFIYEEDAQSELISFEYEPGMSSAGEYYFVLDDEGSRNTCDVIALVYNDLDDGRVKVEGAWDGIDEYGDDYVTDLVSFHISKNGDISFYED